MPKAICRRPLRAPPDTPDSVIRNFEKRDAAYLKGKSIKMLGSKSGRTRMVGGLPQQFTASAGLPLRSSGVHMNRLQGHGTSLMENRARSAMMVETLMQGQRTASEFLTLRCDKGRMVRSKTTPLQVGTGIPCDTGGVKRISHAQTLQLFQALMKEPLSFLELRCRFGVSRQTVKRLVKNGLLAETWGAKAVGVSFVPSDKGRVYFKELEAAAMYRPSARNNVIIRLKQSTAI